MYHIKPDKRSQASAAMLYGALMECLREKPFEQISITELSARATVGRSTFYRNFDEIADLLYWKCDQQFADVLQRYLREVHPSGQPLGLPQYMFGYWMEHSEVLETLLSIRRIDIIYDCFARNSAIVLQPLQKQNPIPPEEYQYFLSIRIGIFIGVIEAWLRGGKKETAQQLAQMLGRQFDFVANHDLMF